jgi:hypothetical protein
MNMKSLVLAVAVAAGVALSAGTADAQFRSRGSYVYSYPTYTYSYPTYTVPSYYSPVVTSSYIPVETRSYTPGTVIYSGGTYYDSVRSVPTYSYPTYYGNYYTPGVNIMPE